jgi:hypothetical protein
LLPFLASAQQVGRGSCEYASDDPGNTGLTFCTHVANEELCVAEAAKKVSSMEWLKSHPPKFTSGGDCTDGGKALKSSPRKTKAGKTGLKTKKASGGASDTDARRAD